MSQYHTLRRITVILLLLLLTGIFILGYYAFNIVTQSSADYCKSDWLTWQLLASDQIKNAPSVSQDERFHYQMRDGSAPEINEISFLNATDTASWKTT